MKWALSTALGLIALQALVTHGASGRVGQFFADVNRLVERALDPTVPAIPDRRQPASADPNEGKTKATKTTIPRLPAIGVQRAV